MHILILGGRQFVGRHLVYAALLRGHRLTLFNRGQTNPELFPNIEQLHGDRDGGLDVLAGRRWDVCIDTCGYVPRLVRASAEVLAARVEHYTFISSVAVYADLATPNLNEESPVGTLDDETVEEVTGKTYGPLKALCEQAVEAVMPGRVLIVRPGLIVGPHDPTDRFTYWLDRLDRGGEVLAPGRPQRLVQLIDVRDLAAWIIRLIEARGVGVFNATGPGRPLKMAQLLDTAREVAGRQASFTWVDDDFLVQHKVRPYTELPLWIPARDDTVDSSRALAAGLNLRPLVETAADTLEWHRSRPPETQLRAGLSPQREAQLLALWHERGTSPSSQPGPARASI